MSTLSKEQIAEWKAKYGELREIVLPKVDREEGENIPEAKFWLRKPDRATIKYAQSKQIKADGSLDTISAGEVILRKCYLGGDDVQTEDHYYFRACIESFGYMTFFLGF